MNVLRYNTRQFFLFGMRLFFGSWLLYGGLYKWIGIGPNDFVGMIAGMFDPTWSPHVLNVGLAWIILVAEVILPALILLGWRPRLIWSLTAALMFMLTLGQTLLMSEQVIANWQFTVLVLVCAALSPPERPSANPAG